MRLYGTHTSPFVRRIRILAAELGEPVDWIDTALPEGQEQLLELTPLAKVPVAVIDGDTVFDSRLISDRLVAARGFGPLRATVPQDAQLRTVADGALDSAINWFYLVRRDGADPELPYLRKQRVRVDAALAWLAARVKNGRSFHEGGGLGLTEIAVVTMLDWMRFRDVSPVAAHPILGPLSEAWADRASFAGTVPR